ncbi:SpoVR family protein [bacterium]|nr:SpoVR family protein [bacterium]
MMSLNLQDLEDWDNKVRALVDRYGLKCYPQEFEICDHFEMIGYMAYSGMPSRYSHWSYGKTYEIQKTMYDYGVGGLPYEMVINSSPCIAYLMRDNTDLLHILTIAHVYGHNDFFANNFMFRLGTNAPYVIEMFKNHAKRVRSYIEDPSIGINAVERILDSAHALSLQRTRNPGIRKLSHVEAVKREIDRANPPRDQYAEIHPQVERQSANIDKFPIEPEQNVLDFIAKHSSVLNSWERDLVSIVDQEAEYFIPQIETKIMNEGWASYWHYKLIQELRLPEQYHLEFIVRHNQVLRPTPGGLNPYHLGFIIWNNIEQRWNEGKTGQEYRVEKRPLPSTENDSPGRKKIFEVRESDRDASFLRRFLTPEIMRELDLFEHERRGKERVITKVSDDESYEQVRETLVKNVGMGSIPIIKIHDADFGGRRTLYLKHEHDGRDLQLEYAEKTLTHLETLWGREVLLETTVNNRPSLLKLVGQAIKVERL